MNGLGKILYEKTNELINNYINSLVKDVKKLPDDNYLSGMGEIWSKVYILQKNIASALWYLVYFNNLQNDNLASLEEVDRRNVEWDGKIDVTKLKTDIIVLVDFSNTILKQDNRIDKVVKHLLDEYTKHRKGMIIDENVLHSLGKMLVALTELENNTLYNENFEKKFLESTKDFYTENGREMISTILSLYDYCEATGKKIDHEQTKYFYLLPSTRSKVHDILIKTLISDNYIKLLDREEGGFQQVMNNVNNRKKELRKIYEIFNEDYNAVKKLCNDFELYFRTVSDNFIGDSNEMEKPVEWATKYIQIYDDAGELVSYSFKFDKDFDKAKKSVYLKIFRHSVIHLKVYMNHVLLLQ